MTQKLDWNTVDGGMDRLPDDQPGWRSLIVSDGMVASEAALPDGLSVREALADYAAGYEGADEVQVRWELWEGGTQRDRGRDRLRAGASHA